MRRSLLPVLLAPFLVSASALVPVPGLTAPPALAQEVVSVEFRTALEPYGEFRRVGRYGEVWVPRVSRDWRPYTVGHWVYSDDYGWYWESERDETPWGWVAFHYGRWVFEDSVGWVWVPGREWGPAWVEWRHGRGHVGWAPLPPDDRIVEVRDDLDYWTFVRPHDFLAPAIVSVMVRPERSFFRETVVVNETVTVRGYAVNPGIAPAYLATELGRPIPTFHVRPRVLAGTVSLPNAIEIRRDEIRNVRERFARESNVVRTDQTIEASRDARPPQPLQPNQRGVLGSHPPKAAEADGRQPQNAGAPDTGTTGRAGTASEPMREGDRNRDADGRREDRDAGRSAEDRHHGRTPGAGEMRTKDGDRMKDADRQRQGATQDERDRNDRDRPGRSAVDQSDRRGPDAAKDAKPRDAKEDRSGRTGAAGKADRSQETTGKAGARDALRPDGRERDATKPEAGRDRGPQVSPRSEQRRDERRGRDAKQAPATRETVGERGRGGSEAREPQTVGRSPADTRHDATSPGRGGGTADRGRLEPRAAAPQTRPEAPPMHGGPAGPGGAGPAAVRQAPEPQTVGRAPGGGGGAPAGRGAGGPPQAAPGGGAGGPGHGGAGGAGGPGHDRGGHP